MSVTPTASVVGGVDANGWIKHGHGGKIVPESKTGGLGTRTNPLIIGELAHKLRSTAKRNFQT